MITQYTYSISQDTLNNKVNPTRLHREISQSSIVIAIQGITTVGDNLIVEMKDVLSAQDEATLDSLVNAHTGELDPDTLTTADGKPILVVEPRTDVSNPTLITPDWCDKTTWYYESTRVTNEQLVHVQNNQVYSSANPFWIDLRDGKLTQAESIWPTYRPVVRVDNVVQVLNSTEQQNGNYDYNAETGVVTFNQPLTPGAVVTADYSYAVSSRWKVIPLPGRKLSIRAVEIQFSKDIEITTAAIFAVHGPIDVFAPHLLQSNGGPFPSGTKIPLRVNRYDRMYNFIDEAQHSYPDIPALGGNSWRGMSQPMHIFRWPYTGAYGTPTVLDATKGMELHISLENNIPYAGTRAIVTLYTRSEPE